MLRRLREETLIVVERTRLEQDDSIERRQRASPIRRVKVNELQVAQHPGQDVPRAARFQHRRIQLDRLPVDLSETRANLVEGENLAADERIDDQLAALINRLNQEMSREGNAEEVDAEPAADFQIYHRKRNRNSEPAIDHVVQKGISRVFKILGVALESLQLEQEMRKQLDILDGVFAGANYGFRFARQRRQLVQVRVDVEVGILFLCDQQRASRQGHRLPFRNHRKFTSRVVHSC